MSSLRSRPNRQQHTLKRAAENGDAADAVSFVELHNISKHAIYLTEAFEATQSTLAAIMQEHERRTAVNTSAVSSNAASILRYQSTLFKATQLRLGSLEKRIQNITSMV